MPFMFLIESPMGKTSWNGSLLNLPGKAAWFFMEIPGSIILIYIMCFLPQTLSLSFFSLPWENWVLASLFLIHYSYRAVLFPYLAPSISPIHPLVFSFAVLFQLLNATSIAGWLAGYGPTTKLDWTPYGASSFTSGTGSSDISPWTSAVRMQLGLLIWALGFAGTIYHDDELREIRREAGRKQEKKEAEASRNAAKGSSTSNGHGNAKKNGKSNVDKIYLLPEKGLFKYVLYPHYLFEWLEWIGFWIVAGWDCVPARNFIICEVAVMLPRAVAGRRWYVKRFGKEKVGRRKVVIPGVF